MRIASIDILRAITMLLMIWVNDFWTLKEVPKWLSHAKATEDYMGFSDIIFPLFLFIVGLSIPFAIKNRLDKGDTRRTIAKHIWIRSLSLLLIGLFMVNWETAYSPEILGGKTIWGLLMAFAVALIWMNWKRSPVPKGFHLPLQITGFAILFYLALIYRGGANGDLWFTTQWWGILGLIGWAYLFNGLIYLYAQGNLKLMFLVWLVLNALAVVNFSDFAIKEQGLLSLFSTIYTGTIPAFTTAGILATSLFLKLPKDRWNKILTWLVIAGIINISYGLVTREIWGISKIQGTPSWLAICTGIGLILFPVLYLIADINGKVSWAKLIAPAGTATLTCYMLPYFIYPLSELLGVQLPEVLVSSWIGLMISMLFAFLVVVLTGFFQRKGFSLKL